MVKKILSLLIAVAMLMAAYAVAEESWMPEEWDYNADVVVVGFGPAGAMAAKSAKENGASVLILEKASKELAGGSAPTSLGYSQSQSADSLFQSSLGSITMETAEHIASNAEEAFAWLNENGLEMRGSIAVGNGRGFYGAIVKGIESMGIQTLYETPAEKLICDPTTHEVYGVQCITSQGETLFIKANKGVILCTGGYAANKELMTRFHFSELIDYALVGAPTQTGDGLMMALQAGAALDGVSNQQIEWYGYSYKIASDEMGTGILHMLADTSPAARIFVNGKGERFMDEEEYITHSKSQLSFLDYDGTFPNYNGYTNLPMYVVFDSSVFNSGAVGAYDYGCGYASLYDVYNWSADNQAELERGWLVKADTIEELTEKLAAQSGNTAIDAQTLKATIQTYNTYCEQGADADYGRDALFLNPISEGPYYAAQIVPTVAYTIGGLQGGQNGETLDWQGNPIPRLYHAGDIGQPTKLRISALRGCMGLGAIAGKACSQLEAH